MEVPSLEAPTVEAQPLPGRAYPRVSEQVSSASFGSPEGAGLEAVGNVMAAQERKAKLESDQLRVIDANTQLEAGRDALLYGKPGSDGTRQGGAFSLHGTDAMALPDKFLPAYKQLTDNISQGLTPDQQRMFAPHIAAGQNELNLQLNRYEYEESNRLSAEVFKNGAQQAIEGASVGWRDPVVIGKSRADIKALVQLQGNREGWDQGTRDDNTKHLLAEMHYSVVDRMLADGDPKSALQYFVGTKQNPGIRDSNELTGEQAHQIGAAIDSAMKQQQAQVQGDVAGRVRDVRAAAMNGMLVPPSTVPSNAELQAAFPDTWRELRDGITRDVAMGSDIKRFATLTPAELAAHVESYRPTEVAGAAEGLERYQIAASAAQRVQADRAKDPRQFAIDNKLGSKPLDFSDQDALGQELRSRLASTPQLSQQFGGYVPALTRDESAHLSQMLDNQKPADRVRTLNALHDAVGEDVGFQNIMRQVLPGSPVTAMVGSQIAAANAHQTPVWFDGKYATPFADQTKILEGESLLNPKADEKGAKKAMVMPADAGQTGLRQRFATLTGDAFRGRADLEDAAYQTFKDAYAGLSSDKGDYSGIIDFGRTKQAAKMALGNIVDFHGRNIIVPQGMDPSRFDGLFDKALDYQARQYGAPKDWRDKIGGYQLQEVGGVGSGRYMLVSGNGPLWQPKTEHVPNRDEFMVDIRQAYTGHGSHGSPEDVSRAAAAHGQSTQQPEETSGTTRVPAPPLRAPPPLKPPPLHVGGGGKGGKPHPSQAEAPET